MCDRIFAPFCPSIVHSNWILERGKTNNSYVQYFKLHSVQINYSMPDWRLIEAMSLKSTPKTAFSKWCNNFQYLLLTIVKRTFTHELHPFLLNLSYEFQIKLGHSYVFLFWSSKTSI